jgi:hypothetical protein
MLDPATKSPATRHFGVHYKPDFRVHYKPDLTSSSAAMAPNSKVM